jgi:hypothetical protein
LPQYETEYQCDHASQCSNRICTHRGKHTDTLIAGSSHCTANKITCSFVGNALVRCTPVEVKAPVAV